MGFEYNPTSSACQYFIIIGEWRAKTFENNSFGGYAVAKFGSDEHTGTLFDFYIKQVNLIEELYKDNNFYNATGRFSELYLLFFSLHSTGLAIAHLAKGKFLNESFMLARSQVEKIINYLYLLYCDDEEYQNYLAYSKQKQFRMFNRSINVGELNAEIRRSVQLNEDVDLQAAKQRFTSKSGKEVRRWSNRSIPDRLSIVESKLGKDVSVFMLSYLGIHENASEALHGTIYGVAFNIGLWRGKTPSSIEELSKSWNEQFSMLFIMLGTCIHILLKAIHTEIPVENIKSQSSENVSDIINDSPFD